MFLVRPWMLLFLISTCPPSPSFYLSLSKFVLLSSFFYHKQIWQRMERVACGAMSSYNKKEPVYNLFQVIAKRINIQAPSLTFLIPHLPDLPPPYCISIANLITRASLSSITWELVQWTKEGKIKTRKTFFEGLDNMVPALKSLFEGSNVGKVIVHIADPS